jgi:hypothetical protein
MDADAVCASKHSAQVYPENDGDQGRWFDKKRLHLREDWSGRKVVPRAFGACSPRSDRLHLSAPRLRHPANETLKIVNSDPTTHNVHALAEVNEEFNVGQHQGQPPVLRKFAKPEVTAPIVCNQHPWMRAIAHVVSNPYFTVTDADGNYELKGLPPGKYAIVAVHERFGSSEQQVTVAAGKAAPADFTFSAGQAYLASPFRMLHALVLP